MKILFFGDIVGKVGRKGVSQIIPQLKKEYKPDIIIANGENASHGSGITEKNFHELREAGVDAFTTGNHVWRRKDTHQLLDQYSDVIIRPHNYSSELPGSGILDLKLGKKRLIVLNLMGRVFMKDHIDCPFKIFDTLYKNILEKSDAFVMVDFHAEATSEKKAFGMYVDGRVNGCVGTHTHIATADSGVLLGGSAYVTDVGGCYAKDSILGVEKHGIIENFLTQLPQRHEFPQDGICQINAVLLHFTKKRNVIIQIITDVEVE